MEALLCGQTTYPAGEYESTWRTVKTSLLSEQFQVNIILKFQVNIQV